MHEKDAAPVLVILQKDAAASAIEGAAPSDQKRLYLETSPGLGISTRNDAGPLRASTCGIDDGTGDHRL
jgi:hypothetical protein